MGIRTRMYLCFVYRGCRSGGTIIVNMSMPNIMTYRAMIAEHKIAEGIEDTIYTAIIRCITSIDIYRTQRFLSSGSIHH